MRSLLTILVWCFVIVRAFCVLVMNSPDITYTVNYVHITIYNGPTNAFVCNKALIQMSHTKTLKITPTYRYISLIVHHDINQFVITNLMHICFIS
jgi:hypothetical protein